MRTQKWKVILAAFSGKERGDMLKKVGLWLVCASSSCIFFLKKISYLREVAVKFAFYTELAS